MITGCAQCGGLRATEQFEVFAGTPCRCGSDLMNEVRALIGYAQTESPDPYEVIRRANIISAQFNAKH